MDEAVEDYNEAMRLNPKDPEAPFNRGMAHLRSARYDHAARDFSEVIMLQPKNAEAHVYRGLVRIYQDNDKEADADFRRAFQLDPRLKAKLQPIIDEARKQRGKK
jgi:tetratricopeptide (TPR) repeat protein